MTSERHDLCKVSKKDLGLGLGLVSDRTFRRLGLEEIWESLVPGKKPKRLGLGAEGLVYIPADSNSNLVNNTKQHKHYAYSYTQCIARKN
jgi:hypothetical protein